MHLFVLNNGVDVFTSTVVFSTFLYFEAKQKILCNTLLLNFFDIIFFHFAHSVFRYIYLTRIPKKVIIQYCCVLTHFLEGVCGGVEKLQKTVFFAITAKR